MSTPTPPPTEKPWEPYLEPAARNYLFVCLASLLVMAAVLFVRGGLPAALIPVLLAVLGLIGRWTAMPVLCVLAVVWFLFFPYGVPFSQSPFSDVPASPFRVLDLALVGAVSTYLATQMRLFGLTHQAVPPDSPVRRKGDRPVRRPDALVPPDEMGKMFFLLGACVLAGQLVWLLLVVLRVDPRVFPPVSVAEDPFSPLPRRGGPFGASSPSDRFVLLAGLLGAVGVAAGLYFWYWRLARLSRDEARMVLLDTEWSDNRREINRQEKWRAWARNRNRKLKRETRRPPPPPAAPRSGCRTWLIFLGVVAVVAVVWFCLFCGLSSWITRRF